MSYLTDRRGDLRADPRHLLPSARSILCVGKLYNTAAPYSTQANEDGRGWIARYAWGADYHDGMRAALEEVVDRLSDQVKKPFEWRICVDTAPLLERSLARLAGLGWVGKNTCLINQEGGSWFLLGEVLLSLPITPDSAAPDRCGTCRRCVDACPTNALVPDETGHFRLDSRQCISYLTIEKRGAIAETLESQLGHHVFGCDICQDVCPWNRKAAATPNIFPDWFAPSLLDLSHLRDDEFRQTFRKSAIWRIKYVRFLRNVAIAMGNSSRPEFVQPLQRLAEQSSGLVAETANRALGRLLGRIQK